jgi:YD repeat-containing protein
MACILTLLIGSAAGVRADSAQYYYDPAGRLTAMVDPVNGSAQYNYDAVGNILSVVRRPITDLMVAQLSPSRGLAGTVVTISGTGFGTTADTTVSFNGQSAAPTAVSATQITVTVPSGATSGAVSVTSPVGTASSNAGFIVTPINPVSISGVSPSPADQGATITISGSGFDTTPTNNKVLINGRFAAVSTATGSALTALVPAVSSGRVTVSTKDGTASSSGYLAVPPLSFQASSIGSVVNSAIGNSATLSIASAGKIGLILFDATAGQQMAMTVTASSFGGATLTLYGPDGSAVTSINPISTGTVIGRQFLTLTGTYAVLLAPASGQTGSATVSLNAVPPDVTATIAANATPVSLTTTLPGQNMRLTFNGTAGQSIDLLAQFSGLGGCPTFGVTILQPDGVTRLFSNTGCGNGPLFTGPLLLPVGGTYTIMVSLVGTAVSMGTFTLYTVPPDVTATIAANGTPVSLTTTVPGQNMSLTFNGTAGQRIALLAQFSGLGGCSSFGLTILQPDGATQFFSNTGCGNGPLFMEPLTLPVGGAYTIMVGLAGTNVGTGTFTLYSVPPDVTATIAANATPVSLTTTVAGQNMSLTFTGTAGQRISLLTQGSASLNSCGIVMQILQPDGTTKLYSDPCLTTSPRFSDVLILPVAGTYTIQYNPSGTLIGTATFTLNTVPPDITGTISVGGGAVSLTTTVAGQNMSLTFTGTAGQRISLLTQSDVPLNGCGIVMQILEPDGTTKLYSDGCLTAAPRFSDVLILPVAGTYTIQYSPGGAAIGTATFTLINVPADVSATITPGGGTVSLTTTVPGQNMSLTFNGTAGQRVSLLTQSDTPLNGCGIVMQILQPDGTTKLYSDTCLTVSPRFSDVLILPVAGTYTIQYNPSGTAIGTATFTLYNVPPDVTGTTTVGQAAANYATTVPGQAIQVSFAGTSGQSVTVAAGVVSATPSSPCYKITTLAPNATTVRGDQSCSAIYSSGSLSLSQNGTYTVIVKPTGVAFGTFSVGVSTP